MLGRRVWRPSQSGYANGEPDNTQSEREQEKRHVQDSQG
jgi:hypothetical protein